ncbi:MAG: hypothetical protein U0795_07360 [Pirellulales bacterium]
MRRHLSHVRLAQRGIAYSIGYVNRPSVIVLWDAVADQQLLDLGQGLWGLGYVAYSPDGKTLAVWSRSYDPTDEIRLWDVPSGKLRATLRPRGVAALAFSPDGKMLATSTGATIQLWDVPARAENSSE